MKINFKDWKVKLESTWKGLENEFEKLKSSI